MKQRRVEVYDWGNLETTVSLLLMYAMSFVHKDFVGDGRGGKGWEGVEGATTEG